MASYTPKEPVGAFSGVKRDAHGAFYYDDGDVKKVRVPLSDRAEGDLRLSHQQLSEWFGVRDSTLPEPPEFFISPRLYSEKGGTYESGWSWSNIEGEILVYKPLEWVPTVASIKTWPKNEIITELHEEEITTTITKLFASVEFSLEVSAGGNFMGVKAEAKAKTETSLSQDWERKKTSSYIRNGKVGEKPLAEIAVGLMLRVQEIYRHEIRSENGLWIDGRKKGDSLGWRGGPSWSDICVADKNLRHVTGLQFHDLNTSGPGHSSSLYVQALPGLSKTGKVEKLHLVLSCAGWTDWYQFVVGHQWRSEDEGHKQLLIYPRFNPSTTFMALGEIK